MCASLIGIMKSNIRGRALPIQRSHVAFAWESCPYLIASREDASVAAACADWDVSSRFTPTCPRTSLLRHGLDPGGHLLQGESDRP